MICWTDKETGKTEREKNKNNKLLEILLETNAEHLPNAHEQEIR